MTNVAGTESCKNPPRYLWLKRLLLMGGLVLVGVLGLRLAWGWMADQRLIARQMLLYKDGAPLGAGDFPVVVVDSDRNAGRVLKQAAADVVPGNEPLGIFTWSYSAAARRRGPEVTEKLLGDNARALAGVAAAREMPRADWGVVLASPFVTVGAPHVEGQRQLARLLFFDAKVAMDAGDSVRVAQRLNDMLMLGERLRQGHGFLISSLVASAIDALACELVKLWLCSEAPELDERTRVLLGEALARLLDEAPVRKTDERGYDVERLVIGDALQAARWSPLSLTAFTFPMPPATPPMSLVGWALEPMYKLDAERQMLRMRRYAQSAHAETIEQARALVPDLPVLDNDLARYSQTLAFLLSPSFDNAARAMHRTHASRRCAAIAIAARLYRADHGAWPADQAALVPAYLPRVLEDPFAAPGTPLVYEITEAGVRILTPAEEIRSAMIVYGCGGLDDDEPLTDEVIEAIRLFRLEAGE